MNYKDPSLKPFGLLDTSFTSTRHSDQFFDDVVNEKVITNPDMIEKANQRWELALNLGMPGTRRTYVGTFYASGDTYHHLTQRGVDLNFHSCYEVNREKSRFTEFGIPVKLMVNRERPVLFSKPYLEMQEQRMGPVMFAVQMLGAPASYEVTEFREDWFRWYDSSPEKVRGYTVLCVDPANSKGKNSHSRTAMTVTRLGSDQNYYLVDGVLDRLNLAERTDALFGLVSKWNVDEVRYEQVGYAADVDHMRGEMDRRGFHFEIRALKAVMSKDKRIEHLIPVFKSHRFYFPRVGIPYHMKDSNELVDLVRWLIERELLPFPNVQHLDFSDALSRLEEPGIVNEWPLRSPDSYDDAWRRELYAENKPSRNLSWQSN
jgi:phage terminase large subunit-like protein